MLIPIQRIGYVGDQAGVAIPILSEIWMAMLCTELCPSSNSHIEALTPKVSIFGDRTDKEVIKVKWGHREGL